MFCDDLRTILVSLTVFTTKQTTIKNQHFKTLFNLLIMSNNIPAVRRLPSEGGTEEILSTREGGAMGTIVGTPETKYGG